MIVGASASPCSLREESIGGIPSLRWIAGFCLLDAIAPIPRPPSAVSKRNCPHAIVEICIDDEIRKPLHQISASSIFPKRTEFRKAADRSKRVSNFSFKVEAQTRTLFLIVRNGRPQLLLGFAEDTRRSHRYLALISERTSSAGRATAVPSFTD